MQQKLTTKRLLILVLILIGLGYSIGAYKDFKKGFIEGYKSNTFNYKSKPKEQKENNTINMQQTMLINTFCL